MERLTPFSLISHKETFTAETEIIHGSSVENCIKVFLNGLRLANELTPMADRKLAVNQTSSFTI
jgi:hypothetical protein